MMDSLRQRFTSLMSIFKRNGRDRNRPPKRAFGYSDVKEIEGTVDTFRRLVSQLSRDGNEIGQRCVQAEKRAAHYALISETVVESVSSGIVVIEAGGSVSLVNSSAKRILCLAEDEDVIGCRLGDLFGKSDDLERLVAESIREGRNSPRNLLSLDTVDGRHKRIGASVSCLRSSDSRVGAAVVVFAELKGDAGTTPAARDDERAQEEYQSYLRGVLDAYDLLSTVMIEADRIRSRAGSGALEVKDLAEFSSSLKRVSDLMMAFALAKAAYDAVPELVDLNSVIESVITRNGFETGPRLVKHLHGALPRIKTIGKVLETGLEMLIAGCLETADEGIEIVTGQWRDGGKDWAGVVIRERSVTRPILEIRNGLRDFIGSGDMHREAGLILLSSLPPDTHRVDVVKRGDHLNFSIGILVPLTDGARPGAQTGDAADRGQDET
jgi:PAS domain-containing protein